MSHIPPPPSRTPLLAPEPSSDSLVSRIVSTVARLVIRQEWLQWLRTLVDGLNDTSALIGSVALTAQGAAITTTNVPANLTETGLYKVSWYARITRAATSSSSLTVTIGWTDGAVAVTSAGAAITGNTTATVQSGSLLVRADVDTNITYATAYASAGATSMQYQLDVIVERVG